MGSEVFNGRFFVGSLCSGTDVTADVGALLAELMALRGELAAEKKKRSEAEESAAEYRRALYEAKDGARTATARAERLENLVREIERAVEDGAKRISFARLLHVLRHVLDTDRPCWDGFLTRPEDRDCRRY